jgi:predicted N-acetyltransferase YhbS
VAPAVRTLQAWVAVTDDTPVAGHVIFRQPLPGKRSAEVSQLFVGPAARQQGVASALLEAATRSAAANDLDLFLDVTDHLRAARALYERAGFRLVTTTEADWTAPDGRPVTLHRYASNFRLRSQSENPPDLKVRKSSDMGSHAVVTALNSTA